MNQAMGKVEIKAPLVRMRNSSILLFILVFVLCFAVFCVYADEWATTSQANFDNGTYTNTEYNASGFVQLAGTI